MQNRHSKRSLRLAVVCGAVFSLFTSVGTAAAAVPTTVPPIQNRTSANVTADALLPTPQIDGVVWSQVVIGNKVFAGGEFTTARPAGAAPGTNTQARGNLLLYSLSTGSLRPFAPNINGPIDALAASPDGKTLYVVGQFTKVGSANRTRFAAFEVSTGKLRAIAPSFNSRVRAVMAINNSVYVGGWFTTANGYTRTRLAAISATTGKLRSWRPTADESVNALVATPDKKSIVIGGSFKYLSTKLAPGMGRVDPSTGAVLTWKINSVVRDNGPNAGILSLSADADTVYGSGFAYGGGNYEGVFAAKPSDGSIVWLQDCHGDTYSVLPMGSTIYSVGHSHYCKNIGGYPDTSPRTRWQRAVAVTKAVKGTVAPNGQPGAYYGDFGGKPAPGLINWFPDLTAGSYTGMTQAAWNVVGSSSYIALGGEFTAVNGVQQQGLVRFAVPSVAPNAVGPRLDGPDTAPTLTSDVTGVRVQWLTNADYDDAKLTYRVLRDGQVIYTNIKTAYFWDRQTRTFTDSNATAGTTHSYQVKATDPDGNSIMSPVSTITIAG